jgi:hypothetical protein
MLWCFGVAAAACFIGVPSFGAALIVTRREVLVKQGAGAVIPYVCFKESAVEFIKSDPYKVEGQAGSAGG